MARIDRGEPPQSGILAQAAEWFAVLRGEDATAADRQRWQDWLAADPRHRQAWERVERIEQRFHRLPALPARAALKTAGSGRCQALKVLATLAVGGPLLWGAWRPAPLEQWQADCRTGVGEIRAWQLADGSRVWLNTASALDLRYDTTERRLRLLAGEVLIETAPDHRSPARPLILETRAGELRPLGTRFSAHARDDQVTVRVFEGAVALQPAAVTTGPEIIGAGRKTRFTPVGVAQPQPLSSTDPAWSRGFLMADGMRLGNFLEELGRYRRGYLGYAPEVADLRLVGAFPVTDTDRVLAALADSLPVRVRRVTPWWVRVEGR